MVPNKRILKSDLWDGKYTNKSSISVMCSSETQIPPIDISIFIQWEGSSLDLPGKRYEKRVHGFQANTHLATSITSQAHWHDFITAPYKKITSKFYFFYGLSSFFSFSPWKIPFPYQVVAVRRQHCLGRLFIWDPTPKRQCG